MYSSNLTSKGQVTVPVGIRRKLGLKPGEPVRFKLTSQDQVIIEKNNWKDDLAELRNEVADQFRKRGIKPVSDEELDRLIDQSAATAAMADEQPNCAKDNQDSERTDD